MSEQPDTIETDSPMLVTEDGRIFYDLDVLVDMLTPGVMKRSEAADALADPYHQAASMGEQRILLAVLQSVKVLRKQYNLPTPPCGGCGKVHDEVPEPDPDHDPAYVASQTHNDEDDTRYGQYL